VVNLRFKPVTFWFYNKPGIIIKSPLACEWLSYCNLGKITPNNTSHIQAMPEETIKTNRQILDKMVHILEKQKELIELYRKTHNKDYLSQYEIFSFEFHKLRQSLKQPPPLT
jgi:hypothetical protein